LERRFLEQPEEFEDDHDDDNHSNDVKDVSVHAGDSYQTECAVASIIQTERVPEYAAWEFTQLWPYTLITKSPKGVHGLASQSRY